MIDYTEDWLLPLVFRLKGSVMIRASYFAIPATLFALFLVSIDDWIPDFRKETGLLDANKSQLWSASTGVLAILLGFRTNRAMSRFWEGTGLLHQMRGEWFDSVSCCITFSRAAVDMLPLEVNQFRHTIVRLMSLCHGSALEEIAGDQSGHITAIDSFGLDNATLRHLKECKEKHGFNRVEVLLHLTQSIITKAHDDGILKIPPPILSRVYQTLSRGFVNLLNAKKIADTRFPFPYAQIITMLLLVHVLLTPIMLSSLIPHRVICPLFVFVPIFGMFYLNFVGVELENPFGDDDNDLPLEHFQSEMNNCLLMLLQENADLIATIDSHRCTTDFNTLKESLKHRSDEDMNHRRISQFEWGYDMDALESESDDNQKATDRGMLSMTVPTDVVPIRSDKDVDSWQAGTIRGYGHGPNYSGNPMAKEDLRRGAVTPPEPMPLPPAPQQKLEASIFSGAIESFLEASQPMVLEKVQFEMDPKPLTGGLSQELLQQPGSIHNSSLAPPIMAPSTFFDDQPPMYSSSEPPDSYRSSSAPPHVTRLAYPMANKGTSQPNPVRNSSVIAATQRSAAAERLSGAEPKRLDHGIETSMGEFKEALDSWTKLIEGQLGELRQNVASLRRFSDTIPDLLDKRASVKSRS